MTCEMILEQLLEADLAELRPDPSSPLGAHLEGCPRCRKVAAQLLADTTALAAATRTVPVVATRPGRWLLPTLATAATAAVVAVATWPKASVPTTTSEPVVPTVTAVVAEPTPALATAPTSSAATVPAIRSQEPAVRQPTPRAAPIAPVAYATPEQVRPMPVRVRPTSPTPYTASAALPTSTDDMPSTTLPSAEPGVTVIWFTPTN